MTSGIGTPGPRPRRGPGLRARLALAALALVSTVLGASGSAVAALSPEALMALLAERVSGTVAFREERFFGRLTEPVVLTGTLTFRPPDYLEKTVESPRPERTVIEGNRMRIEGAGDEQPRTALLSDFPALEATIVSIRATLSGDLETLRRHFALGVVGTRNDWTLRLLPRSGEAQRRIAEIVISGKMGTPRRILVRHPDGDRIVTHIRVDE